MSKQPKTISVNDLIANARMNADCGEYASPSEVIELCDAMESLLALPMANSKLEAEIDLLKSDQDSAMKVLGEANALLVKARNQLTSGKWKLVPVEPTEDMIVDGFESEPCAPFSSEEDWKEYQEMSGCAQAAHRAKLCWAAMLKAAPAPEAIE